MSELLQFKVPEGELYQPERGYEGLNGDYMAIFNGIKHREVNETSTRLEADFTDFDVDGQVQGRHIQWGIWWTYQGEDPKEGAQRGLLSLTVALGLAEASNNGTGNEYSFPVTDFDELLDLINGMRGTPVATRVKTRKRPRKDGEGEWIDESVTRVATTLDNLKK